MIEIGLKFSSVERKLGEIDRARAIYTYLSPFADPKSDVQKLWQTWEDFEYHHGNIETYTDLVRIKRKIENNYNLLPPDMEQLQKLVQEEAFIPPQAKTAQETLESTIVEEEIV